MVQFIDINYLVIKVMAQERYIFLIVLFSLLVLFSVFMIKFKFNLNETFGNDK